MKNLKEVDDKKLHAGMLEAAEKAVAGRGDGRISENDAKDILKHLDNDPSNVGRKTWNHILENYNITSNAKKIALPMSNNVEAIESEKDGYYPAINAYTCQEGDVYVIANNYLLGSGFPPADIGSQLVLHPEGSNTDNHTRILALADGGGIANQWMLFVNTSKPKDENGNTIWWHLVNLNSGKFLDINTGDGSLELYDAIDGGLKSVNRDYASWKICSNNFRAFGKGNSFCLACILNCEIDAFVTKDDKDATLEPWSSSNYNVWSFYWLANQKPNFQQDPVPTIQGPISKNEDGKVLYTRWATIPFYYIEDSEYPDFQWRAQNSPFYKLKRVAKWKLVDYIENLNGVNPSPLTYSVANQVGFSNTQSETFSASVGISVEAGISDPAGPSVKATVSAQLGYSTSKQFTNSFSKTEKRAYTVTAPAHGEGFIWALEIEYVLCRQDDSVVKSWAYTDKGMHTSSYRKKQGNLEAVSSFKNYFNEPE